MGVFLVLMGLIHIPSAVAAPPLAGDQVCVNGAGTAIVNGTYTYATDSYFHNATNTIIFYTGSLWSMGADDFSVLYYTMTEAEDNDMTAPGLNGAAVWMTVAGGVAPVPTVVNGSCAGYGSNPAPGSTLSMTTTQGTDATSTVTVSETGNDTLDVTNIAITGADAGKFSVTPASFSIADGGAAQDVVVTCDASTVGTFTKATLEVTHNGTNITSPATYPLSCTVSAVPIAPVGGVVHDVSDE